MHPLKLFTAGLLAAAVACVAPHDPSLWVFRTDRPWLAGDSNALTPAVDGDLVFFCGGYFWNDDDAIHALSLKDGRLVWKRRVGKCGSTPWLVASTLVVHSRESRYGSCVFQAFDRATGTVRWRQEFQTDVPLSISKCVIRDAVVGDSLVFAFVGDQQVHAVHAGDGTFERFTFPVERPRDERLWLAGSGSQAWVGFGRHVWRWPAGRSQPEEAIGLSVDPESPEYAATNGTLLFLGGREPASLRAFDLTTGQLRWEKRPLPKMQTISADHQRLYVNIWRNRFELVAMEANTGRELWTLGSGGFYPPTTTNGWLYANGLFSVLIGDPMTGRAVRTIRAEAEVVTSPVRARDLLLFGTINGALHAVRADE